MTTTAWLALKMKTKMQTQMKMSQRNPSPLPLASRACLFLTALSTMLCLSYKVCPNPW